jgi:hypothetical protein
MPTYYISLSLTSPPDFSDAALVELLRQAVDRADCVAVDITTRGMVPDAEPDVLGLVETAIRVKLAARGGSLDSMTVRRILAGGRSRRSDH